MRHEKFQRMNLEQQRVKQKLFRAGPLRGIVTQALWDEVFLLSFLEALNRPLNVFWCHHRAGVAVPLDLKRCHLQSAHAERVDVDGRCERAGNRIHGDRTILWCDKVHVLDVLSTRLHMVINRIRRYTTNFN